MLCRCTQCGHVAAYDNQLRGSVQTCPRCSRPFYLYYVTIPTKMPWYCYSGNIIALWIIVSFFIAGIYHNTTVSIMDNILVFSSIYFGIYFLLLIELLFKYLNGIYCILKTKSELEYYTIDPTIDDKYRFKRDPKK
jgi:hypothetical protein